jgi:hypothetical protein
VARVADEISQGSSEANAYYSRPHQAKGISPHLDCAIATKSLGDAVPSVYNTKPEEAAGTLVGLSTVCSHHAVGGEGSMYAWHAREHPAKLAG